MVGETETRRTVACETLPELLLADELEAEVEYQYPRMNPEIVVAESSMLQSSCSHCHLDDSCMKQVS